MASANHIPEGMSGVVAHLHIKGAAAAIEFYKKAFGAEEIWRSPAPDGARVMHAQIRVNGAAVMIADEFPEYGPPTSPTSLGGTTVTLHMYVRDVNAAFDRAVKAGATSKMAPMDMFWGDRYSMVTDPFGHDWSIATHLKDMTPEEVGAAAKAFFSQAPGCCGEKH